ncbi:MAG TPA: hypothetical protein PKM82_05935, partial [Acidovorax sp.]|nr:hypothetical protein [Acidovorax sp.]
RKQKKPASVTCGLGKFWRRLCYYMRLTPLHAARQVFGRDSPRDSLSRLCNRLWKFRARLFSHPKSPPFSRTRAVFFLTAIPAQAGDIRVFAPKKPAILSNAGDAI